MRIAYFISPHGFGHAARSAAIMNALRIRVPDLQLSIFGLTPDWFFKDSFLSDYSFHPCQTDIGLIQKSPMEHDLPATLSALHAYLEKIPKETKELAKVLNEEKTALVICDISPLGIMAAKEAAIPCILFENFTWDWIYQPYEAAYPEFCSINKTLKEIFSTADFHLQTEPLCDFHPEYDLLVPPVSREKRTDSATIRQRLEIPVGHKIGLISMGGIPENFDFALNHQIPKGISLVIPGTFDHQERHGAMTLLPHHSNFYHPDLMGAADFVIGKTGYSTIAENCMSGIPFGYLLRENFRESEVLGKYLEGFENTLLVKNEAFETFALNETIEKIVQMKRRPPQTVNGSQIAADFILQKLQAA